MEDDVGNSVRIFVAADEAKPLVGERPKVYAPKDPSGAVRSAASKYTLTGLAEKIRVLPVGEELLIPIDPQWSGYDVRSFRNRVGVTCTRESHNSTGSKLITRMAPAGLQVFRVACPNGGSQA